MTAAQLTGLDATEIGKYRMFRSPGFELPEQPAPISPYFMGLWLGDGTRCSTAISNNHEAETREFLASYAAELDLHLVWHGNLAYTIVGRSRIVGRPFPTGTIQNPGIRSAKREARQTSIKRRLAAGWTFLPNRLRGEARIWQPPPSLMDVLDKNRADLKHDLSSPIKPPARRQRFHPVNHDLSSMSLDDQQPEIPDSAPMGVKVKGHRTVGSGPLASI